MISLEQNPFWTGGDFTVGDDPSYDMSWPTYHDLVERAALAIKAEIRQYVKALSKKPTHVTISHTWFHTLSYYEYQKEFPDQWELFVLDGVWLIPKPVCNCYGGDGYPPPDWRDDDGFVFVPSEEQFKYHLFCLRKGKPDFKLIKGGKSDGNIKT